MSVLSSLRSYFDKNKKVVISTFVLFVIGIILGVVLAYRAVDGSFERVARVDAETGAGKVFFISLLALIGCYFAILISGINGKTVVILCLPFVLAGALLGKYSTALVCRYESFGILNLLAVYLPFFFISFVLMTLASSLAIYPQVAYADADVVSRLKPSFVKILKLFAINVAVGIFFILIIGSIFGVIIVKLY